MSKLETNTTNLQTILEAVNNLPEAVTGDVIGTLDESNNILLSGNLTNGIYILKYENEDGTYTEVGSLTVGKTGITNLADPTSSDWVNESRLSGNGTVMEREGAVVTNYINCMRGDVIRVYGIDFTNHFNAGNTSAPYMYVEYASDNSFDCIDLNNYQNKFSTVCTADGNIITIFKILCLNGDDSQMMSTKGEILRIRLSGLLMLDSVNDVIITKNEEIEIDM